MIRQRGQGRALASDHNRDVPSLGRRHALGAMSLIAALLLSLLAAPLAAQSSNDGSDFEVLRVDLSGQEGLVMFRPQSDAGADSTLEVTVEGENVAASQLLPIHRSSVESYTVVVIDDSATADQIAGFSRIKAAAQEFIDGLAADTRVMLIRAGGNQVEVRPEVQFTSDHGAVRSAIDGLAPEGGAVTWNAIAEATKAFGDRDGFRNVVVFAGSPGLASSVEPNIAQGNLLSANAALTIVSPDVANLDISDFEAVAANVRGSLVLTGSADADVVAQAARAADLQEGLLVGRFDSSGVVAFTPGASADQSPTNDVVVRYGGAVERVRVVPEGIAIGDGLIAPPIVETSRFGILQGNQGALIAIGLAIVAVLLFSFSMFQIFAGDDNSLNSTLSMYGAQDRTEAEIAADEAFASQRSKIIEQVVEKAEEAAASRGNLGSTTNLLEKAEIPLRVGEAFAIQVGIVFVAMILGFLLSGGNPFIALALAVPAALMPIMYVKFKVKRRAKKLEAQLPDTLTLLASTLKAGYSFVQGMDAVGNEAEEPLAGEFRRTVNEARLGKELDDALDDLADRVASTDLLWAIIAIKIQREVGGNLAELLNTVADTMTARTRLRGEVAALTAEGRISALVLIVLPFGVGIAMYFMNPEYISALWSSNIGYGAMAGAMFNIIIGAFWMKKIIDIEI